MPKYDPRAVDRPSVPVTRDHDDPTRLHLLRLALDLQLDAMLLTLASSAAAEREGDPYAGVPWDRWLAEDLDTARRLTTALLENDGAPPVRGGGFADPGRRDPLDCLVVRYESMEGLLAGLVDGGLPDPWRADAAADCLSRCRHRLGEIHVERRRILTLRAARTASAEHFIPGQLLG